MATANPYAAWGKANAPGSYTNFSGNPYADWGNKASAAIEQQRQSLLTKLSQPAQPAQPSLAKPNMPKVDPNKINDLKTLQMALRNNQISHDQFIQRFAKISPVPGGTNPYSLGNIAGAVGDTVKQMTYDVPKGVVEGAITGLTGNKTLEQQQNLMDTSTANTLAAIKNYKAGKISRSAEQQALNENDQTYSDVNQSIGDVANKANPRNIIASGANTLSYMLPVGRVAQLSSRLAKFALPAVVGGAGGFLGGLEGPTPNYKSAAVQGVVQGLGFGVGGLATKNPASKAIVDHYTASENPTPEETKALSWLTQNPNRAMKAYNDRVQAKFGANNVVAGDEAKYIIPGFDATKSISYHEPASALAKVKYDQLLADPKTVDKPVLIMAGGTGAGKTSALKQVGKDMNEYAAVVDTNSNNLPSTESKIKKALDSGRQVEVAYVYRDPLDAFKNGVIPRQAKEGRIVGVGAHTDTHFGSYETVQALDKRFANNPDVNIKAIINSGKPSNATFGDLANLPEMKYNRTQLVTELQKEIDNAFTQGKITEAEKNTYLGDAEKYAASQGEAVRPSTQGLTEPQTVADLSPESKSYLGENADQLKGNYVAASNADRLEGPENDFHSYVLAQRRAGKTYQQIFDEAKGPAKKVAVKTEPKPKAEEGTVVQPNPFEPGTHSFELYQEANPKAAIPKEYGTAEPVTKTPARKVVKATTSKPAATKAPKPIATEPVNENLAKGGAPARIKRGYESSKNITDTQAREMAKDSIRHYVQRGETVAQLKAGSMGGTLGDFQGSYSIGGYLDGKNVGSNNFLVKLADGRTYQYKLQDLYDAVKAEHPPQTEAPLEGGHTPETAQLWEDKYADQADRYNVQSDKLAKQLKVAKAAEKPAIQKRLDAVNKKAAIHEERFIKEAKDLQAKTAPAEKPETVPKINPKTPSKAEFDKAVESGVKKFGEQVRKVEANKSPSVYGPAAAETRSQIIAEFEDKYGRNSALKIAEAVEAKANAELPKENIKVLTGAEKAKASSGVVNIPSDASKAETEQLVEQVATGYPNTTAFVKDTAEGYFKLDKSLKGGEMRKVDELGGAGQYIRTSEHTQFYRDFYAKNKKAPSLADYEAAVRKEFEGKGGNVVQDTHEKSVFQLIKDRIDAAKARELAGEQGGYVAPGEMIKPVKDFLAETKRTSEIKGNLVDKIEMLKGNATADKEAVTGLLKGTEKFKGSDLEAAYHYAEDKSIKLTPEQQKIYDDYVAPLQSETRKAMESLRKAGVMVDENHIHRIAIGKGSGLEQFLRGETSMPREGGVLRKTTNAMRGRTMKVIEDENGNRTVVSIKSKMNELTGKVKPGGKRVTAFKDGVPTDLGPLKHATIPQVTEFYDAGLMKGLNKLADDLGIEHVRTNKTIGGRKAHAGWAVPSEGKIYTRAASPEDVILHEIAHILDTRYDLQDVFNARYNKEIRALADLRFEGTPAENVAAAKLRYVRKGTEKIANMFEVYLHAPERFKQIAPDTYKEFVSFLKSKPELRPITELKPSMVLGQQTVGDANLPNVFVDRAGKVYKIAEATTKEIEANTKVRYYKNPIVNSAMDYIATRQAERANQFLEEWKADPGFKEIALKDGEGVIPSGWKPTKAPQFRGYQFDPKIAEVLDDFAGRTHDDPLEALNAMNRFLRTTIFFNPLIHIPNVVMHWVPNRGISGWVTPKGYVRLIKYGGKAIHEVTQAGPLYTEMLRNGAPFMSFDQEKFAEQIYQMMDDQMKNPSVAQRLSDALGYADPIRAVEAWYNLSHAATWYSNDILTMQAILEEMDKGKSMQEAIARVGDHIPNYRVPSRILGSRALRKGLTNPNLTMFSAYHYGVLKNYSTTVRDLLGREASLKDRAAMTDKLLMAGVVAFVVYPLMDKAAQSLAGNQNAIFRRSGPFAWPRAIYDVTKGKRGVGSAVETAVTPAPGTKGLLQLWENRDSFGNQIFKPSDVHNPKQLTKDITDYIGTLVAPVSGYQRASRSPAALKKFVLGLIGISQPKSNTQTLVNTLLGNQYGGSGMTVDQQRAAAAKAAARQQIIEGKGDSLAKQLVASGVLSQGGLSKFEDEAKWTPDQRAFDSLTTTNKWTVLQKASPAERKAFIPDLQTFLQDLARTAADKNAKLSNRQAAKSIIQLFGGNQDQLMSGYKAQHKAFKSKSNSSSANNSGIL